MSPLNGVELAASPSQRTSLCRSARNGLFRCRDQAPFGEIIGSNAFRLALSHRALPWDRSPLTQPLRRGVRYPFEKCGHSGEGQCLALWSCRSRSLHTKVSVFRQTPRVRVTPRRSTRAQTSRMATAPLPLEPFLWRCRDMSVLPSGRLQLIPSRERCSAARASNAANVVH